MRLFKLALVIATLALVLSFNACNDAADSNRTAGLTNAPANVPSNSAARTQTPTPSAAQPTPDEFASVRGIYASTCQNCHQADGTGGEITLDEGGKIKVPNFRSEGSKRHTTEQLVRKITNGDVEEGMPSFKPPKLTEEQINLLARFIQKEFQGKTEAAGGANTGAPTSAH